MNDSNTFTPLAIDYKLQRGAGYSTHPKHLNSGSIFNTTTTVKKLRRGACYQSLLTPIFDDLQKLVQGYQFEQIIRLIETANDKQNAR